MPKRRNSTPRRETAGINVALKDLQGELTRLRVVLKDKEWSSRKTSEGIRTLYKELEQKNEELKKLDQLKSNFVSTVSHELRTPLSIIKEGVSLVLGGIPGDVNEKQRTMLRMAKENIDRLERIINDLLDISKIEAGRIEFRRTLIDFSGMVKNICAAWRTESSKKQQSLRVLLPISPINAYVDSDKVTQVLNNLISNAIKFTPQKGNITVELKDKGDQIEVSVSDTGIGVAEEDLPKMFSKFQQFGRISGPGQKGTGLGLAISREFIQLHRGDITLESELGKGSKFTFFLPKVTVEEVFKEYIESGIREVSARKAPLSLVVIRVAGFEKLQKDLGREKIQGIFNEIEKIIKDSLRRRGDAVIRGVDEFVILLFDTTKENIAVVRSRIKEAADSHLCKSEKKWGRKIDIIISNATYPDEARDGEELLNRARAIHNKKRAT